MTYHYDNRAPRNSWLPAEHACPEIVKHLMLGDDIIYNGTTIERYEHCVTHRFINLDHTCQAWQIVVNPHTDEIGARRITLDEARRHVLGEGNVS